MIHRQESSHMLRFVRCVISGATHCIRMSWVRSITNVYESNITHDASKELLFASIHDEKYPVINLSYHFYNYKIESSGFEKILLLNVEDTYFGILVESIEGIIEVSSHKIHPIPKIVGGGAIDYFDSIIILQDEFILSLSPDTIYVRFCSTEHNIFKCKNEDKIQSPVRFAFKDNIQKKLILFKTDAEQKLTYGLSITQIPQILQMSKIFPIPRSESFVLGVVEWRGIVLPVINISLCMGGAKSEIRTDSRLLIVRLTLSHLYVALPILSHITIHSLPLNKKIFHDSESLHASAVCEKFNYEGEQLIIPNIDKVVLS